MRKPMTRRLLVLFGLLAMLVAGTSTSSAQTAPWRLVQGSDGTLYLVTSDTSYVVNPDPISDDDLAALNDGGTLGSQLPVPTQQVVSLVAPPAPAPATATPLPPTNTPAPVAPAATPTPAPAPAAPIVLQGKGQTATNPITPPASVSVVTLTHNGQRNFIVDAFHGGRRDNLVNAIGAYQGARPLAGTDPVTFDIQADGAWTIQIASIAIGGTPAFSGKGDSVSALFDPPAPGPWQIMHNGQRNFIVELHCAGGDTGVQNEIGPVNGSRVVEFPQGPCFWEVIADGVWSLQPRS
jgi:hypothetical protein